MAIHFEGKFKGTRGAVNLCKQWAMSPIQGETTKNPAEVDCKACAKQLGLTPAAKAAAANTATGTCQACFGTWKLVGKAGKISLHGYERPGMGWIQGRCFGAQHPAFQVSCERSQAYAAVLRSMVAEHTAQLTALQAGEVEALHHEITDCDAPRGRDGRRPVKQVRVVKGAAELTLPGSSMFQRIPSFAELAKRRAGALEGAIRGLNAEISGVDAKIAGWTPAQ